MNKRKITGSYLLLCIVLFSAFNFCCNSVLKETELKNRVSLETKSLLKYYFLEHLKDDSVFLYQKPKGIYPGSCFKEIVSFTKDFMLSEQDLMNEGLKDTVNWSADVIPFGKILKEQDADKFTGRRKGYYPAIYKKGYYILSHPIFSKNFRYAIFDSGYLCGSRCGEGSVFIFEHHKTGWRIIKTFCGVDI